MHSIWTHPETAEHRPGWVAGGAIHVAAPSRFGEAQIRAMRQDGPATAAECIALVERFRLWEFAAAQAQAAPG